MKSTRQFRQADYAGTESLEIKLGDALPEDHLARYIVSVVELLDLDEIYIKYGARGGSAYAPELMLGLLLYGYATGTFSSRKIERATYEQIPYRYIAGNMHPDHDTINEFRKQNLVELKGLFVQVLLMAHMMGYLKLGNISIDGTKLHADASKSKAVSYKRIGQIEVRLQDEIDRLFQLAEEDGGTDDDFDIDNEIQRRRSKLDSLAQAKAVLEARAAERDAAAEAEYNAKMTERKAKEERTGKKSRGRKPKPPETGPRDKDQYNFTDPESRIMKNGNKKGFEQCFNGQAGVEHESRLIVSNTLTNHPNDKQEAIPVIDAIPHALGVPDAAALDNGYMSLANITGLEERGITPYIATGRDSHHVDLDSLLADIPEPPHDNANPIAKMVYTLKTAAGKAIYKLRKSTVEPVFGIIKEVMGFRQFSLRTLAAAAGEWNLVCLAYNLKRLHVLGPLA
jgi:transposase